ncbi:hypothetical protein [Streptomyces hainanensis]|uniref:Uncharacterized protein n=1 Tax=Streptomyces hainanensis TaxID=402648 RepID=A0A4R4TIW0_9ACTN|nr:hypothetical protein [Streptomyces hainanensis]TDC76326.1 hypothetical protein E1283_10055 [Streptomyces hainanensis]
MYPTGFPNDFVCDASFAAAAKTFLGLRLARWPGLLLNEEPFGEAALASWALPDTREERFPELMSFCRDAAMNEFWEENGYALDSSGEGPFSLFFRIRSSPLFAAHLSGVRETGRGDAPPTDFEQVGLLLGDFYSVCLLTPDDPATDGFSRGVLRDLVRSFGGDAL